MVYDTNREGEREKEEMILLSIEFARQASAISRAVHLAAIEKQRTQRNERKRRISISKSAVFETDHVDTVSLFRRNLPRLVIDSFTNVRSVPQQFIQTRGKGNDEFKHFNVRS